MSDATGELTKRTVLTRFWVGDTVCHRLGEDRGIVVSVHLMTDRLVPRYEVVWDDRKTETCEEMELSPTKVFISANSEA